MPFSHEKKVVNMDQLLVKEISNTLNVKETQVQSVLSLLDEGNTIPFIARYRKEVTGGLDEEQINEIHKSWEYGINLFKRKEDVIRLIEEKRDDDGCLKGTNLVIQ